MRERVCKNCGGRAYKVVGQNMVKCKFCGTLYVDEHASKEEEILIVGANEILRETRFEEAVEEFDKILSLYPLSFEGHFGKALAKNKIVFYNNKKGTTKRPRFFGETIPSILEDEDFKRAMELAPQEVAKTYIEHAKRIDKLHTLLLEEKKECDLIVASAGDIDTEILSKFAEEIRQKNVYFVPTQEEKEEKTFKALKTAKVFVLFVASIKALNDGDIKNLYDRYLYFVSERQKAKSSLILAIDPEKVSAKDLPKELLSCKSVIEINSISFLQDIKLKIQQEISNTINEQVKLDTVKLEKVSPQKKEYIDLESIETSELGHYHIENVELSDANKIKWIFLTIKHGDFNSADELIKAELEKDPNNAELLFAELLTLRKINTQDEFFSNISNFTDRDRIDKILTYSNKDFAEFFVDRWEELIVSLDNEEYYNSYLLYLAQFNSPYREKFVSSAENKAVETMNNELIEKVLKCFKNNEVDRFVNFYFMLAQKSDNQEYYQKILEIDAGHEQSNMAILLQNFKTDEEKLNFRDRDKIEETFKYLSDETRFQFVFSIINMILPIAFYDLEKAEKQFDFYLAYITDDKKLAMLLKLISSKLQEEGFFKSAEKYISIAISKNKNAENFWSLIQIKAHCRNDQELIMTNVKITQMPEWETLLSLSDEKQTEKFAEIISKNNLYKGEKSALKPEMLDKAEFSQKMNDFLLRNQNILLEMEKENQNTKGVDYYRSQLKPFEKYLQDLPNINNFQDYDDMTSKVYSRLAALNLSLESSINVLNLTEKEEGLKNIFQAKEKSLENRKKTIKNFEKTKFLKNFILIFLEICPLAFTFILFLVLIFLPKEVYLYFNQTFLIVSLIYSVCVGMGNLVAFVLHKQKISKKKKLVRLSVLALGILNLILFCFGYYLFPKTISIDNTSEFQKLLKNAEKANYELSTDIDLNEITWKPVLFSGKLDGKGHKITNLTLSDNIKNAGLFSVNYGDIKNLEIELSNMIYRDVINFGSVAASNFGKIENCKVTAQLTFEIDKNANVGGLVGINEGGQILSCETNLIVNISVSSEKTSFGGLVGVVKAGKESTILKRNKSSVTLSSASQKSSNLNYGGLVGLANMVSDIDLSENEAHVDFDLSGNVSNLVAGGLVGQGNSSSKNNFSTGDINCSNILGNGYVGGLYGQYINSNLLQEVCYSYSTVTVQNSNMKVGSLIGGLGGVLNSCFSTFESEFYGQEMFAPTQEINCHNSYTLALNFDENIWDLSKSLPILK